MKKLALAIMLGLGVMVSGCGHEQATPTLVQMDDGKYTMSCGDDYGVSYLKGYSDEQVTNYKMVRIIGEKANFTTAYEFVKFVKNNTFLAMANVQYLGDAVEYEGKVYQSVNSSTHVYEGQKLIVVAKEKDSQKITIDGEFKQYALGEVTKVERDNNGHLTHYTIKVVKDMKAVKSDDVEHLEVNE